MRLQENNDNQNDVKSYLNENLNEFYNIHGKSKRKSFHPREKKRIFILM